MNLYEMLWSRIGGCPWTYILRDTWYKLEGIWIIGLVAVAAAARQVVAGLLTPESREKLELQAQTMPYDKRVELEHKYGHWAVETAIGICPHNDIRCIEREAKRLYESRVLRR